MPTILVIDDSTTVLAFAQQILLDASLDVITATDGQKGLQCLRDQTVDLILTDIYMPGLDGLEVIRLARQIRPGVRCIVMSSKEGRLSLFDVAKALGAISSLQKPFTREQLIEHVATALERPADRMHAAVRGFGRGLWEEKSNAGC